jgi:hypothetical protein
VLCKESVEQSAVVRIGIGNDRVNIGLLSIDDGLARNKSIRLSASRVEAVLYSTHVDDSDLPNTTSSLWIRCNKTTMTQLRSLVLACKESKLYTAMTSGV